MSSRSPFRHAGVEVDLARLAAEVAEFPKVAWRRDPLDNARSFVALVHRRGDHTDDRWGGAVRPTTWLDESSYLAEVIAALGVVVGRARLVRTVLGEHRSTPDLHPFRAEHDVVRLPVVVPTGAVTVCGDDEWQLPAGSVWRFDGLHHLEVRGPEGAEHVHLEVLTVGDVAADEEASSADRGSSGLVLERLSCSANDPPGRVSLRVQRVGALLPQSAVGDAARRALDEFVEEWRATWVVRRSGATGVPFAEVRRRLAVALDGFADSDEPVPCVGVSVVELLRAIFVQVAVTESGGSPSGRPSTDPRFDRPVFLVGSPRAGLRRLLDAVVGDRSAVTVDTGVLSFLGRVREAVGHDRSDRLAPELLDDRLAAQLRDAVFESLSDADGTPPAMNATGLRLVDADPRNALCVPLLDRVFPDARYVFVTRDPRVEIAALVEAWQSDEIGRRTDLPGWDGPPWALVVPPGWSDLAGRSVLEICAAQWEAVTATALADLDRVAPGRWTAVDHDVLVARPRRELRRLLRFAGFDPNIADDRVAPLDRYRTSSTNRQLRRADWAVVEPVVAATASAARQVADVRPARRQAITTPPRSHRTGSGVFSELLDRAGASLLVVAGDQGGLLTVRADEGQLDIDLVPLAGARAVTASSRREFVVATTTDVWRYRRHRSGSAGSGDGADDASMPDLRTERPSGSMFVLRSGHHTGALDVQDMACDDDGELWLVSSRYSCLATIDAEYSFVPRWVPGFVSRLAADDRCHLSGVALRDGRPRYVTAFAEADRGGAWRDTRTFGGIVVDADTDEIVVRGLCMPFSPRWHGDRLWVLEAGSGRLGTVDLEAGRFEPVVECPGFARAMAVVGRFGLVATNALRSTMVAGVPLAESGGSAHVALSVVDLEAGQLVASMPLGDVLGEIAGVGIVPVRRVQVAATGSEPHERSVVVPPSRWSGAVDDR